MCKCEIMRTRHKNNSMRYAGVKLPQQLQCAQVKVAEWESGVPSEMECSQNEKGSGAL